MDPNTTLAELRSLLRDVDDPTVARTYLTAALAERVQALDEWLTAGGYLPTAWRTP